MRANAFLSLSILFLLFTTAAWAQPSLAHIFGDHMVLQRDMPINVWGWSKPGEKINVKFHNQSVKGTADKTGTWKVTLAPESAGGPFNLEVIAKSGSLQFSDVLVGEVWICSGQSNMEWTVSNSNNAEKEISDASFSMIRHIKVPNMVSAQPQKDIAVTPWKVCSPESVGEFTAVGYFFAREISRKLNVPVGLVNTSWGGTHSETWTSRGAFESSDEFREMISKMPSIDLEKMGKEKAEAMATSIKKIQSAFPPAKEDVATWKSPDADDGKWPSMNVPGQWESQGFQSLDGHVWFRKEFSLTGAEAGQSAVLSLGMIDDSDETFLNGVSIGATQQKWNSHRKYQIQDGVLREGRNVVVVRVHDTGGGGGFHGEAGDVALSVAGRRIALAGPWKFQIEDVSSSASVGPNDYPTLLYNAMLHPLIPYTIRGALWYQGESNAGRAFQYRKAFPLMINDWRKQWKQGDFPFYFVQLSSWNADNGNSEKGSSWAELREAQTQTLSLPNTGMAVTIDIGNPTDIHPRNKQDVGLRLAAVALSGTYGKQLVSRGPVYQSMKIEGSKAIVSFSSVGSGLVVRDKYGYIRGFEVAGNDGKFKPARAFVVGGSVEVFSPEVTSPVAVRYAWADDAGECNLFNSEGFPAEPFRTDSWKGITESAKFSFSLN